MPDDALTALHALVLADVALQDTLGDIEDSRTFAARAAEAARAAGVDLDAGHLEALLYMPPPSPVLEGLSPLRGWLPAEVSQVDGRPVVAWLRFGRRRLTEPFYDDSLVLARRLPFNRLFGFRTPLAELEAWSGALAPPSKPDGLIFHMSRCGSTLAAQMLAAPARYIMVSEAAPIDAIVQLADHDEEAKAALLRAMVAVLGQTRNPGETRRFVKLDCWHSLDLPLFRRAFPDTPWVFLYRDPVEVMVSHVRQRGMQMVPSLVAPALFGIDLADAPPDEDYCARVLAAVCAGAVRHYPQGGGLVVDYRELPEALFTRILPHFGVAVSEAEADAMRQATVRDAKAPEQAFAPDGETKRRAATVTVREICERRLGPVHRRLEALRVEEI
uniref:Aspartyl/asparaginyl beta-hydroxylase n=1 Tax=Caulobacter sp. (strain K31) TaxID=366602 RepID=B0T2U8_CAUSK